MISRWWMALAFALVLGVSSVLSGVGGATGSDIAVDNALFLPMVSQAGLSITPSLAPTQAPPQQPTPVPTPNRISNRCSHQGPQQRRPLKRQQRRLPRRRQASSTETPSTPVATTTSTPIPSTKTPTGDMILIAAGEFEMGCDEEREARTLPNEKPLPSI